ncbi:MAG: adenylate kinase [Coleofasciculaceae cyanobacterium SM2_1_6]|nr:adenylate kinase [Coleofasciculaceae cyanobacterium SM2_1_6]
MTKNRLIFLGPPGAGKGTQAKILADYLGIPHISTGEILRKAKQEGTPVGLQAKAYMDRGDLVPDSVLQELVRERLQQTDAQTQGWILDGFPRTLVQANFLETLLPEINQSCNLAINITVADEVLVSRLGKRAELEGRSDDTEEVIRNRLVVYGQETAPLIDFYQKSSNTTLVTVDGDRSLEVITDELKKLTA